MQGRGQMASSGRQITRLDLEPELRAASEMGLPLYLVVVNQRTGTKGTWLIDPGQFEKMTVNDTDQDSE
jgi:hypothetical protein